MFRTKTTTYKYRKLSKVLDMFDVTMLGLGRTIGVGSYIFIGHYAKTIGPAMIISHLFAATVSFMNALCYAEFVSREPGSGGAYSQAYYLLGEFLAAIIGWLLMMENIFGSALSARGLSKVIDNATDKKISNYVKSYVTFSSPILADFPDIIAFLAVLVLLTVVSFGIKEVAHLNNIIVGVNTSVLMMIVLVSGSNIQFSNWSLPPAKDCGKGGFMPYGVQSVWHGINEVFYSYVGFDAAAHAGSEVSNPERSVPTALLISVIIVTTLYLFQSFTHTLLWPYCDQDNIAPIQYTMSGIGLDIMKKVTDVGCYVSLIGNMICTTYPLTRLVYALAEDGLICTCLADINLYTQTPIIALYTTGIVIATFALLFDSFRLAEISCLGALAAYSFVALCVLTLRYSEEDMELGDMSRSIFKTILNMEPASTRPTVVSSMIVLICSTIILTTAYPVQLLLQFEFESIIKGKKLEVSLLIGIILFYGFIVLIIVNQPPSTERLGIQLDVPTCLRPMLPVCCLLINTHFCTHYSLYTWLISTIWMSVGTFVYFSYGIWKSKARNKESYDPYV